MQRLTKRIFAGMLLCLLLSALSTTAFAAGTVTYDGNAKEFVFAPGSAYAPTDLFDGFKEVMPGDTLREQLIIKNTASDQVSVKLYLRALPVQEASAALLSQLRLTVTGPEDTVLFDAPADQTAQLGDWVFLGTFYSGSEIPLKLTLEVPVTLDSAFQNTVGFVNWEFRAEEISLPDGPNTGDPFLWPVCVIGMLFSAGGIWFLLFYGKKKRSS